MDFSSLVALVNQGGPTVAVIVITIVFLSHIEKERAATVAATKTAVDASAMIQKTSIEATLTAHKLCEEKMETLINKVLTVIQENTKGFAELKEIVRPRTR